MAQDEAESSDQAALRALAGLLAPGPGATPSHLPLAAERTAPSPPDPPPAPTAHRDSLPGTVHAVEPLGWFSVSHRRHWGTLLGGHRGSEGRVSASSCALGTGVWGWHKDLCLPPGTATPAAGDQGGRRAAQGGRWHSLGAPWAGSGHPALTLEVDTGANPEDAGQGGGVQGADVFLEGEGLHGRAAGCSGARNCVGSSSGLCFHFCLPFTSASSSRNFSLWP